MDKLAEFTNEEVYDGAQEPPEYNLTRIKYETTVPIAFFVGQYDLLANPTDSKWTRDLILDGTP